MSRLFSAVILLSVLSLPAQAADFTVDQVIGIGNALAGLNCGNRVVKDGAKESVICEPYKWTPGVSWVIARNLNKAQEVARQFDRMRETEIAKLRRKEDGAPREDAIAALNVLIRGWLDASIKIDLEKLKQSDLEPMNIPPQVIAPLLPIVE